jgi:hypothetical protein
MGADMSEFQEILGRCIMNMPPALRSADPSKAIMEMRQALEKIATQEPTSNMDEDQKEHADFQGAYDKMIAVARQAIAFGAR